LTSETCQAYKKLCSNNSQRFSFETLRTLGRTVGESEKIDQLVMGSE